VCWGGCAGAGLTGGAGQGPPGAGQQVVIQTLQAPVQRVGDAALVVVQRGAEGLLGGVRTAGGVQLGGRGRGEGEGMRGETNSIFET
jgi:hypothetical protein